MSFFKATVGGYQVTLYCFAAFFVLNLVIALVLKGSVASVVAPKASSM